jgi:hypothetical protein
MVRQRSIQRVEPSKAYKRPVLFGMMFFSSIVLNSCAANPGINSAQHFGAMSTQFKEDTNKLADDIYDSCIRRVQFYRTDANEIRKARDQAWLDCNTYNKPAANSARAANQIVVDYAEAIGKLSSNEVVTFDNELKNVGSALKRLSIPTGSGVSVSLPSSAVDTGVQIAGFLANWAANNYRVGKLSEAITCTNEPLQAYTEGLGYALREGYIQGILQQELNQAQFYYDDYTAIAKKEGGTWRDFNSLSKESYNAVLPILQRRNAALSYIAIIDRTAKAHAELTTIFLDGRKPLTTQSTACKTYLALSSSGSDSPPLISQSLSGKELSPQKMMQVQKVLIAYRNDVTPLLERMEDSLKGK